MGAPRLTPIPFAGFMLPVDIITTIQFCNYAFAQQKVRKNSKFFYAQRIKSCQRIERTQQMKTWFLSVGGFSSVGKFLFKSHLL